MKKKRTTQSVRRRHSTSDQSASLEALEPMQLVTLFSQSCGNRQLETAAASLESPAGQQISHYQLK